MRSPFGAAAAVLIALGLQGCLVGSGTDVTGQQALRAQTQRRKSMRAFRSEQELDGYLRELAEKQRHKRQYLKSEGSLSLGLPMADLATESDAYEKAESVTNVQHAGVDEGGIVKVHGHHLVTDMRVRPAS